MKYQQAFLEQFPRQIEYSLQNYVRHNINIDDLNNIIIGGLGGSGIAGRIIRSFYQNACPVPVEVVSDYHLPAYAGGNSLVILNSYSGNTEETLSLYIEAIEKQALILVITTGGLLQELAQENNVQVYLAETGFQPRMALGYSLTYLALIFSELLKQNHHNNIRSFTAGLKNREHYISKAQLLFKVIKKGLKKKIIILTDTLTYPIGIRFAQQLQENAKTEAFVHELPESNHNVIETYYGKMDSVFVFIDSGQNDKITQRFLFLHELLQKNEHLMLSQNLNGFALRDVYEVIYILDWLSLLIAEAKNAKSDVISNINELKLFLSNKN